MIDITIELNDKFYDVLCEDYQIINDFYTSMGLTTYIHIPIKEENKQLIEDISFAYHMNSDKKKYKIPKMIIESKNKGFEFINIIVTGVIGESINKDFRVILMPDKVKYLDVRKLKIEEILKDD